MDKITIERETLKGAIRWHESRIWPGPDEVSVFGALRAALAAQPAQPADAQPTGQSPCARHCEAPAFEGEIRRLKREATIKDSLTIRPPAPAAVPPGYVLVPIEPTPEMVDAGDVARHSVLTQARTSVIYRAMIAAAGDKP